MCTFRPQKSQNKEIVHDNDSEYDDSADYTVKIRGNVLLGTERMWAQKLLWLFDRFYTTSRAFYPLGSY